MSTVGNDATIALWVGHAIFAVVSTVLGFLAYIRNVKKEAQLAYFLVCTITTIASLAYLVMALGGATMKGHDSVRQFEWVRYAAWALEAPLTVFALGLLAGAHWVDQIWVSFATLVGIAAGFAGAVSGGYNATWPLFTFAVATFIPVFIALAFTFRRAAHRSHPEIGKLYDILAFGSLVLYAGYAIVWGVSEGGMKTTVDQEVIIYTCLDVMAQAVFATLLIFGREAVARYGSVNGLLNTGADLDFPIARSTYASSGSNYVTEPAMPVVFGEQRDVAFARLHAATSTGLTKRV